RTPHPAVASPPAEDRAPGRPLRGIFVGRVNEAKGVGVVTLALARNPAVNVSIDRYRPLDDGAPNPVDERAAASGLARYHGLLADDRVVEVMAGYDFVIVPTQVPETGPFTVVEALQAGVPVLGSDIGA